MNKLLLVSMVAMLSPALATANNPWTEHFSEQQLSESLPQELPQVAEAISTARHYSGLENTIGYQQVVDAVNDKLHKEGAGEELEVKLLQHAKGKPVMSHRKPVTFEISDIRYNARELTWEATLYPYEGKRTLAPMKLMGSYDEVVEVPVLTRRIRRDEVISANDIKWSKVESSRLRTDTALEVEQIIGLAPRRTISPNRSVRLAELAKPSVVKKNDNVTIQFRSSMMELKTLGEAMEDGAKGDIIRIRNKDSHQPVQARIIASGLAEAMPMGVLAQAGENY